MNYDGLIPEQQKPVQPAHPHWRYGTIEDGIKKIDPILHYGCFTLGFEYPQIVDKVCEVVKNIKPEIAEVVGTTDLRLNQVSYQLQDKLFKVTGGYNSFYALSGSDANEGAVKLASAYHHTLGNKDKKKIVTLNPSYHGSTYLTSSLGCESLMVDPFYTFEKFSGVIRVDRDFAEDSVDWKEVGAIMVETCSYSDIMTPFTEAFWNKLTYIQQNYDVLIIIDDIFIGGGKTGHYCGWKHLPIVPDIFTMGKAITAGFFPLSATFYNSRVKSVLPDDFKWEHGFTYNFSIPGIVSALEYLDIVHNQEHYERQAAICNRARKTFLINGFDIVNTFGTYFLVKKGDFMNLYMMPLNADDEYFDTLRQDLCTL